VIRMVMFMRLARIGAEVEGESGHDGGTDVWVAAAATLQESDPAVKPVFRTDRPLHFRRLAPTLEA
jgi:hypothetical protein